MVAAAVGGIAGTVVHGTTGEHVPPRRPDPLAAALRGPLADPMRMETYGRLGVERVRHNYTWERIATLTEAVYMRLARRRPGKVAT